MKSLASCAPSLLALMLAAASSANATPLYLKCALMVTNMPHSVLTLDEAGGKVVMLAVSSGKEAAVASKTVVSSAVFGLSSVSWEQDVQGGLGRVVWTLDRNTGEMKLTGFREGKPVSKGISVCTPVEVQTGRKF